jgi:hypothetical protein
VSVSLKLVITGMRRLVCEPVNPVRIFLHYIFLIQFNVIIPHTCRSPRRVITLRFSY